MIEEAILVVEDDAGLRELIVDEIRELDYRTLEAPDAETAVSILAETPVALIVSDLKLPGANGLQLLTDTRNHSMAPQFIMITAFGTIEQAVDALQKGADDFLTKPLNFNHLRLCVERTLNRRRLQQEVDYYRRVMSEGDFHGLIGRSPVMQRLFEQITIIGKANGPVLILGESGTGKELVARALHAESDRQSGPFIAVNCASIPDELLESELFGHTPGAFTGATASRRGLFAEASGGSLLLDEIGEMPLSMQVKLLRTLQEGSIRPVGSDQETSIDTRVFAATNRDLELDIAGDRFRADLFYRLEAFTLQVPPLRERDVDVDLLAAHFIARFGGNEKQIRGLSAGALTCLHNHDFPGNVRELSNAIERAVAFTNDAEIQVEDLPERIRNRPDYRPIMADEGDLKIPVSGDYVPTLSELDRQYAEHVLRLYDGNKSRTAEALGIGRRTLYRLLASTDGDEPN